MNLDLFREPGGPDPQPPAVGDVIMTKRLAKVVTGVRPVESRVWAHRWWIEARLVGRLGNPDTESAVRALVNAGADVRWTFRYERGDGPVEVARAEGWAVDTR